MQGISAKFTVFYKSTYHVGNNLLTVPAIEPVFIGRLSHSLVTIPAELSLSTETNDNRCTLSILKYRCPLCNVPDWHVSRMAWFTQDFFVITL
jgi:hypothetical protein